MVRCLYVALLESEVLAVYFLYVFFSSSSFCPPLMFLFDVQVLDGDVDDPAITAKLWRSFFDLWISMLMLIATRDFLFCGIGCYRIAYRMSCSCLSLKFF